MSDRKPTFFTSDWHIGHANSLVFDSRPFKNLDEMHSSLIRIYNSTVPTNGICYFLGDIGLTSNDLVRSIIEQLQGTKVLVLGNHDKGSNSMYKVGFDVVLNGAILYIAKEKVTLTHCPLLGVYREDTSEMKNSNLNENWHGETRHSQYSVKDEGQFHLHGHIHSGPANTKPHTQNRQFDVGLPANSYRPVSISTIESWISLEVQKSNRLIFNNEDMKHVEVIINSPTTHKFLK